MLLSNHGYTLKTCLLVSVCSLWTLSPAFAVPSTKDPALRELDEHLQINLRQTSKAEQCWKALSMIAEILLPLLLYDIVWYIYIILLLYPNALGIPFFTNLGISGFEGPNWFWSLLVIYNYIYIYSYTIYIPSSHPHGIPTISQLYLVQESPARAPHQSGMQTARCWDPVRADPLRADDRVWANPSLESDLFAAHFLRCFVQLFLLWKDVESRISSRNGKK
jgi:hypothetical protein